MKWNKNTDGKWSFINSDVATSSLTESAKDISKLNIVKSDAGKPVVYIPTHNIHDVYEWYRIFRESYKISDNFDKSGFWINAYFSKDRGQSIEGWFPNLVEVKCASDSDNLVYYVDAGYKRKSVDFIDVGAAYSRLFLDNVEVYEYEFILLKDQHYEIITEYTVENSLNEIDYMYIDYTTIPANSFVVGNPIILQNSTLEYVENVISSLSVVNISGTDYLKIGLVTTLDADVYLTITKAADLTAGTWTKIDTSSTENGIYEYKAGALLRVSEMADKYKTYGQIVYCYQGDANANKEFYLRRIEDDTEPDYSYYPDDSMGLPFVYSEGEAYLIKCEIDYNIDQTDPLLSGVPHRMLMLDSEPAEKVMATGTHGTGTYTPVSNINLGIGFRMNELEFTNIRDMYAATGSNSRGWLTELNGLLYGGTRFGGDNNLGVIFSIDPVTLAYNKLYDFDGTDGSEMNASFIVDGTVLYGIARGGGANSLGVIFSFDTATDTYTNLYDFDSTDGVGSYGSLISYAGIFYGTCPAGGVNNTGTLFSFNPVGSVFTKLYDFDASPAVANGHSPYCTLLEYGGILYGTTIFGGSSNVGVIFSFDPLGPTYTNLHDFNGTNGSTCYFGMAEDAGIFYGHTYIGGTFGRGVLFSYDPLGPTYTKLYDMPVIESYGGSVPTIKDGKIYGTTRAGGTATIGTIFEFDPVSSIFTRLHSFVTADGNNTGNNPHMIIYDNAFYGQSQQGGASGVGTIFKFIYNPDNELESIDDIIFEKTDINGKQNVLQAFVDDAYFGVPIPPVLEFRHAVLDTNEVYTATFDAPTTNTVVIDNTTLPSDKVSYVECNYGASVDKFPTGSIIAGDMVRITINFSRDGADEYIALDHVFVVQEVVANTASFVKLGVFPQIDEDIINEFTSMTDGFGTSYATVTLGLINIYGEDRTSYTTPQYNLELLEGAINSTPIKEVYELIYTTDTSTNNCLIEVRDVRQQHKWRWSNHGLDVYAPDTTTHYYFEHVQSDMIYLKEYHDVNEYITSYLSLPAGMKLAQMADVVLTYNNIANSATRFGIENNKMIFGSDFKEIAIDNIKPSTFINISTVGDTTREVYVHSVEWLENFEEVHVILLTDITMALSGTITIHTIDNISDISKLLKTETINVTAASTGDFDITVAPATMDGVTLIIGQTILLKDNITDSENGTWEFDGAGNPLINQDAINGVYYRPISGYVNSYNSYKLVYDPAMVIGVTSIAFSEEYSDRYNKDSVSYARALMNYVYDVSTVKTGKLINNLTAIAHRGNSEPMISFAKRDKTFPFANDEIIICAAASTANVNVLVAPASIDTFVLSADDLVVLKNQTAPEENGVWVYVSTGNPMTRYDGFDDTDVYEIANGAVNIGKQYEASYDKPLDYGTTVITMTETEWSAKFDPRLTLKPVAIAKLGVDNLTQPWVKINTKYDSLETTENLLDIQVGINSRRNIRFIDGLTEFNILNDINGQGQYDWILEDDVITSDAVVGCTQVDGPGTGTLIWYTGTWTQGTWVDGIWIQGTWEDGTWLNGTWNSFSITDYYYYVTYNEVNNNAMSTWINGTWTNGTFNGGVMNYVVWMDGTFNNGIIQDGTWADGTFTYGIINHILWTTGTFNGGDFQTGVWEGGLFQELDPSKPARFGTESDYTDVDKRSYWKAGIFDGGEFWAGINYVGGVYYPSVNHSASIWYSGDFRSGEWWGGTFVVGAFRGGTWYDGVWLGGWTITSFVDVTSNVKELYIDPAQYDTLLGTVGTYDNTKHRLDEYYETSIYLNAIPTSVTAFGNAAFISEFEKVNSTNYVPKPFSSGYASTLSGLKLDITTASCSGTAYQVENIPSHIVSGKAFAYAVWYGGTWKKGIWVNGYWSDGIWESGLWVNGYWANGTFGLYSA